LGAALVGIIASVPLFYGIIGTVGGFSPWSIDNTIALAIAALIFGTGAGLGMREIFHDDIVDAK
jgi:hypothetical protein